MPGAGAILAWHIGVGHVADQRLIGNGQGTPKTIAVPVYFVYAENDLVANAPINKEFAQQIQQEDKTIVERKGAHHEVLNETDRVELYDMIAKWILDHAKK